MPLHHQGHENFELYILSCSDCDFDSWINRMLCNVRMHGRELVGQDREIQPLNFFSMCLLDGVLV